MMLEKLNEKVRSYWEHQPCGTNQSVTGDMQAGSIAWFERIEGYRYSVEPCIHSVAQFTRYHGKKLLEIGVGAGTDHLQWARAGTKCYGVDLTDAAIETTRSHLSLYGFKSDLKRLDAEVLPFAEDSFDLVYSWGVIHHSEHPQLIINEIKRVLKPGGQFVGMMYNRHSFCAYNSWIKHALLKGKPWQSFKDVIWNHMESLGTKAYTALELKLFFSDFSTFSAEPILTVYDTRPWPTWLSRFFPNQWGWFIAVKATK
jgi:2-polyprenyl-3-methyl-5-hydroxy-6-metoxy-1,4-benzoquinol methylase